MLSYTSAPPTLENLSTYAIRGRGLTRAMPLLVSLVFLLSLTGCAWPRPTGGGVAEVSHTLVDIRDAKVSYDAGSIVKSEGGSVSMNRREAKGTQPDTPAGPATASLDDKGGGKASVPQTEAAPAPPSPTDKALGMAIYIGIGLIVLGVVSLTAKKWLPAIPFGLSVGMIATGIGVMLLATILDSVPWWAWITLGIAGGAVAYFGGAFDNWRKER